MASEIPPRDISSLESVPSSHSDNGDDAAPVANSTCLQQSKISSLKPSANSVKPTAQKGVSDATTKATEGFFKRLISQDAREEIKEIFHEEVGEPVESLMTDKKALIKKTKEKLYSKIGDLEAKIQDTETKTVDQPDNFQVIKANMQLKGVKRTQNTIEKTTETKKPLHWTWNPIAMRSQLLAKAKNDLYENRLQLRNLGRFGDKLTNPLIRTDMKTLANHMLRTCPNSVDTEAILADMEEIIKNSSPKDLPKKLAEFIDQFNDVNVDKNREMLRRKYGIEPDIDKENSNIWKNKENPVPYQDPHGTCRHVEKILRQVAKEMDIELPYGSPHFSNSSKKGYTLNPSTKNLRISPSWGGKTHTASLIVESPGGMRFRLSMTYDKKPSDKQALRDLTARAEKACALVDAFLVDRSVKKIKTNDGLLTVEFSRKKRHRKWKKLPSGKWRKGIANRLLPKNLKPLLKLFQDGPSESEKELGVLLREKETSLVKRLKNVTLEINEYENMNRFFESNDHIESLEKKHIELEDRLKALRKAMDLFSTEKGKPPPVSITSADSAGPSITLSQASDPDGGPAINIYQNDS